jgi:hypothetical protein
MTVNSDRAWNRDSAGRQSRASTTYPGGAWACERVVSQVLPEEAGNLMRCPLRGQCVAPGRGASPHVLMLQSVVLRAGGQWRPLWRLHARKGDKELHTVVQSFCTHAPVTAYLDGEAEYAGRKKQQAHDKNSPSATREGCGAVCCLSLFAEAGCRASGIFGEPKDLDT